MDAVEIVDTVVVPKKGDGGRESPFSADTTEIKWQVIEERETEFVIDILEL